MQSKALHRCLGDFWRTVPPQAPRAAERAGSCRSSLPTAPQGHSCTPGPALPSAHYPIKNKYSLSLSNGSPRHVGIHQHGTVNLCIWSWSKECFQGQVFSPLCFPAFNSTKEELQVELFAAKHLHHQSCLSLNH